MNEAEPWVVCCLIEFTDEGPNELFILAEGTEKQTNDYFDSVEQFPGFTYGGHRPVKLASIHSMPRKVFDDILERHGISTCQTKH